MDPQEARVEDAENRERLYRLRELLQDPARHLDELQRVLAELEPFVRRGAVPEEGAGETVDEARAYLASAPRRSD
ncbi:MAG: hypothetical protein J2P43_09175 [Candidatus Dormibacteraeota bacterium]|nr:hypothetical protein [Candidatus Dormibacteraeota bacterium]MBO0745176.1 hypothetical protein [Candidatus Dormibacteraeota bacterium]